MQVYKFECFPVVVEFFSAVGGFVFIVDVKVNIYHDFLLGSYREG